MVLGLIPTLHLVEAGLPEHIDPLIDVASDIEVGVGARLPRRILKHFRCSLIFSLSIPSLSFILGCEHERLGAAAPNRKTCNRARFEHTVRLGDLVSWAVDELEHQIGHIATKPSVGEGKLRAAGATPIY